jgi:hypothetical protein
MMTFFFDDGDWRGVVLYRVFTGFQLPETSFSEIISSPGKIRKNRPKGRLPDPDAILLFRQSRLYCLIVQNVFSGGEFS